MLASSHIVNAMVKIAMFITQNTNLYPTASVLTLTKQALTIDTGEAAEVADLQSSSKEGLNQ